MAIAVATMIIMTVIFGAIDKTVAGTGVVGAAVVIVIVCALPLRGAIATGTIGVAMWQCCQW